MDKMKSEFLRSEEQKAYVWLRYIDFVFIHLKRMNDIHPALRFLNEKSKVSVNLLNFQFSLNGKLIFNVI